MASLKYLAASAAFLALSAPAALAWSDPIDTQVVDGIVWTLQTAEPGDSIHVTWQAYLDYIEVDQSAGYQAAFSATGGQLVEMNSQLRPAQMWYEAPGVFYGIFAGADWWLPDIPLTEAMIAAGDLAVTDRVADPELVPLAEVLAELEAVEGRLGAQITAIDTAVTAWQADQATAREAWQAQFGADWQAFMADVVDDMTAVDGVATEALDAAATAQAAADAVAAEVSALVPYTDGDVQAVLEDGDYVTADQLRDDETVRALAQSVVDQSDFVTQAELEGRFMRNSGTQLLGANVFGVPMLLVLALAGLSAMFLLCALLLRGLRRTDRQRLNTLEERVEGEGGLVDVTHKTAEVVDGQIRPHVLRLEGRVRGVEDEQATLLGLVSGVTFDVSGLKSAVAELNEPGGKHQLRVTADWDVLISWNLTIKRLAEGKVRVHGVARNKGETHIDVADGGVVKLIANAGKAYANGERWRMPHKNDLVDTAA